MNKEKKKQLNGKRQYKNTRYLGRQGCKLARNAGKYCAGNGVHISPVTLKFPHSYGGQEL